MTEETSCESRVSSLGTLLAITITKTNTEIAKTGLKISLTWMNSKPVRNVVPRGISRTWTSKNLGFRIDFAILVFTSLTIHTGAPDAWEIVLKNLLLIDFRYRTQNSYNPYDAVFQMVRLNCRLLGLDKRILQVIMWIAGEKKVRIYCDPIVPQHSANSIIWIFNLKLSWKRFPEKTINGLS